MEAKIIFEVFNDPEFCNSGTKRHPNGSDECFCDHLSHLGLPYNARTNPDGRENYCNAFHCQSIELKGKGKRWIKTGKCLSSIVRD